MVPRVSVLKALICQDLVNHDMLGSDVSSRRHEMTGPSISHNETTADISVGSYDRRCSGAQVTAAVAYMSTYRDLTTGVIGAITSYYLGQLSDTIGRVKVLALNGIGILISEIIMILVVTFPKYLNYRWLFLSFVIDGLSGSFPLLMATASSYVTDSTSDRDRVVGMGWIQSGMFLGMALGPAIGSVLSSISSSYTPSAIFVYAALCRILALAFLGILPESLPDVKSERDTPKARFRLSHWYSLSFKSMPSFNTLSALFTPESDAVERRQNRINLILHMAVNAIMFGTSVGAMDVMMLYPQSQFKWDMIKTGNFISIINIFRTFSTIVILRLLLRLFSRPLQPGSSISSQDRKQVELPLLRLALCADIAGYIGFGIAPTGFLFVAAGVLSSLSALGLSTSQASMSMMVSVEHIGKLMGILGSVQAVTRLISPPIINLVYAWTVSFIPQIPFFGLAAVLGVGLLMTYFIRQVA